MGDAEGDDDTLKWIKRSKKKQKELAEKRLREQEEQEKQVLEEYGERACHTLPLGASLTFP